MAEFGMVYKAPLIRAFLANQKSQTRRYPTAQNCLVDGSGIGPKRWGAMDFDFEGATLDPGSRQSLHVLSRTFGTTHCISARAKPGDLMWARETFWQDRREHTVAVMDVDGACVYSPADPSAYEKPRFTSLDGVRSNRFWRKRVSIHMPRWACRIEREMVDIGFEQLQMITEDDSIDEGIKEDRVIVGAEFYGNGHHEIHEHRYFAPGFEDLGDHEEWLGFESAAEAFFALWDQVHGKGAANANPWLIKYTLRARANI